MSKLARNLRTYRFAVSAISITLLGILFGALVGRSGSPGFFSRTPQKGELKIANKTLSLRVLGIQERRIGKSQVLFVSLQNISDQNIKAYIVARGRASVTKSYFLDEESLAPNSVEEQIIPLASGAFSFEDGKEFSVAAVLFENGTGDGNELFLSRLMETHAGMRDQAQRLLPCLRQLGFSTETEQQSVLSTCEAEAIRLPVNGTGRSSDYEDGLRNVRQEFLNRLTDIKERLHSKDFITASTKSDKVTRILQNLAQSQQ